MLVEEQGSTLKPETKDVRWFPFEEVNEMFESSPERFFGLEVPALEYYFNQ